MKAVSTVSILLPRWIRTDILYRCLQLHNRLFHGRGVACVGIAGGAGDGKNCDMTDLVVYPRVDSVAAGFFGITEKKEQSANLVGSHTNIKSSRTHAITEPLERGTWDPTKGRKGG